MVSQNTINRYIDEMNELEAISDRRKLYKSEYSRYWWLHKIVYLRGGESESE